jgi:hypothetical protein
MENIPIFIGFKYKNKDGIQKEANVQTKMLCGGWDCKIGNFAENWWFRTKKAQSNKFKGYKDIKGYKKAITLSMKKRGNTEIVFE